MAAHFRPASLSGDGYCCTLAVQSASVGPSLLRGIARVVQLAQARSRLAPAELGISRVACVVVGLPESLVRAATDDYAGYDISLLLALG
jgi:hypothetical protein